MSDTPRTDAATLTEPYQVRELEFEVVGAGEMARLERELNEANAQLRSLNLELKESYKLKDLLVKKHLELGERLKEDNADRLRLREVLERIVAMCDRPGYVRPDWINNALTTPPPPVVAKADADALAEAVEIMRVGICSAAMPNATEREIASDAVKHASEVLKAYRNKYKEGEDNEVP